MFEANPVDYIVEANRECFKCGKMTPIIFTIDPYHDEEVREPCEPSSVVLNQRFFFWKKGINKTQGKEVWANHCTHCGFIQGNGFVRQIFEDIIFEANQSLDRDQEIGELIWHDSIEIQEIAAYITKGYCGLCSKKLHPIKNRRINGKVGKDWKSRRFHIKCWKILKRYEF
jgi:hypothetical protein